MSHNSIDCSEFEVAQLERGVTDEYVPIGCVVNYLGENIVCVAMFRWKLQKVDGGETHSTIKPYMQESQDETGYYYHSKGMYLGKFVDTRVDLNR
jgi:hypothetical protein